VAATEPTGEASELNAALQIATSVAGLAGYVVVLGGVVSWVRLNTAHLPADLTSTLLDPRLLFAVGLRAVLLGALLLTGIAVIAFIAGKPGFDSQERGWRRELGRTDPDELGPGVVRTVAGLNVLALSGAIGLGVASALQSLLATQWVTVAFLVAWFAATVVVARRSGGWLTGRSGKAIQVAIVVVALFCEFPIALLLLTAVAIAASSRWIARLRRPRTVGGFLQSPLPWALAGVYSIVALSFVATPPVSYPRAVVQTASGSQVGGYVARTGDGVYLATCTPLPSDRSSAEHIVLVRGDDVRAVTLGGEPYRLDSGDRPSLLSVLLRPFGVHVEPPVVLRVELRALQPVCDATERSQSGPDHGLGAGVLTDPQAVRTPAPGAERTVAQTTAPALAQLALTYQPTLETTVADRFWPVTVSSVLDERDAHGKRVCLVQGDRCGRRVPTLADLKPTGGATDYLDLPASLASDPTQQFLDYTRGQGIEDTVAKAWLSDPTSLDPWATSAVYFYFAGKVTDVARYGSLPAGLIGLQYWFFYPYNYYPTAVHRALMLASPLAGDIKNTDLHEGDWEHVTVLLDAATHRPRFLYLARHDKEGVTVPWNSPTLSFDGTHPIVQAALGGHPSYDNHCGERPRAILKNQSADWVVCGTGRYAFPAATTPLIDLARSSWACWPGHFGEATAAQRAEAALPESNPGRWRAQFVTVAGPLSPLRQAENAGVCSRGPLLAEETAKITGP
jgi:hypothetical protein